MRRAFRGTLSLLWLVACGGGEGDTAPEDNGQQTAADAGMTGNNTGPAGAHDGGAPNNTTNMPGNGGHDAGNGTAQGAPLFAFSVAQVVAAATPDSIDRETGAPQPGGSTSNAFGTSRAALTADTLMTRFTDQVYTMMTGFTMKAILTNFDSRLNDINGRAAAGTPACLSATVAPSMIVAPDGTGVVIYAQCHDGFAGATDNFVIFGKAPDGTWTVYERSPAGTAVLSAVATAPGASTYNIDGYFSVFPQLDGSGSGLVVHVQANSDLGTVKWTGAYNTSVCGVTYFADATSVYLRGSANDVDQGGNACAAELSAVFRATDLSVDDSAPFDETRVFTGANFIRRVSSTLPAPGGAGGMVAIDAYPGGGNVLLTRTRNAAADLTDLNFGPDVVDALGSSAFTF